MLKNRFYLLGIALLVVIPWKILYKKYYRYKQTLEDHLLFKKRHNSVIMYRANKGIIGWPPNTKQIVSNFKIKDGLDPLYQPIIYFLKTTKKSLDIACMMITVQKVYDGLIETKKKGVNIRLLMNYDHCKNLSTPIKKCIKEGINVQLYISHTSGMESIMHFKYMIKDYEERNGGYVLYGSMNLTNTAFLGNYENMVFSTDPYLVKSIHDNFEECWNYVKLENQSFINKTIISDF